MSKTVVASTEELEAILDEKIMPLVREMEILRASVNALVANKPMMTRSEVARMLGITHKNVEAISCNSWQKATGRRLLKCEATGGRYFYHTEDVLAYKAKTESPAEIGCV